MWTQSRYFYCKKKELEKISNFTGGWTIKKVPKYENTYIQGTYTGLVKFEMKNGKWKTNHLGNQLFHQNI